VNINIVLAQWGHDLYLDTYANSKVNRLVGSFEAFCEQYEHQIDDQVITRYIIRWLSIDMETGECIEKGVSRRGTVKKAIRILNAGTSAPTSTLEVEGDYFDIDPIEEQ
jgi:hypothetical protein